MKAYAYGYILTDGTINTTSSSNGFTAYKVATGQYRVTFSNTAIDDNYSVITTVTDFTQPQIATISKNLDYFDVFIWNIAGTKVDSDFTFVVYKK